LVRLRAGDPPAPTLALVAAVALHEAVSLHAAAVRIKWPNDLVANGMKLAGVLLEREGQAVIAGFGVNLAAHPDLPDRPATDVAAIAGTAPAPGLFAEALAESFRRWLERWRTEGIAPVRRRWLDTAHPVGTKLSTAEGEGRFDGLDDSGALRLRLADGTLRLVHAGDVFLI
jgi:BirA family biotin operon repressor/biotin-[acetyl-CoA-carboxylase] ligase